MHGVGRSVLQFVLDLSTINEDLPMMLRVAENTKIPGFVLDHPERQGNRGAGARPSTPSAMLPRAACRSPRRSPPARSGLMLGLELSRNPFQTHPSYKAIAHLPLKERLQRLHQPEVRAAILSEHATAEPTIRCSSGRTTTRCICSAILPTTNSRRKITLGAQARRRGRQPEALAYDAMLTDDGRGMLYVPFLNYSDGNLDATREMLRDPNSVPGLSDGGAALRHHLRCQLPDLSVDSIWTRDRSRGGQIVDSIRGRGAIAQDRAVGRIV